MNKSIAQTLNASDVIPIIGDKYVVNSLDHSFDTLQTGTSVIWDYSNLVPDNIDTFIAQSTSGSIFPNTDIRFVNPQTGTAHYYNTDATFLEYAGKDDNGSITTYPNPDRLLIFPMQLNSSFIDTIHLAPISSVMLKIGYVENKLDGIGTLILPSGTYSNAYRIKSSYYLKDSSIGAPSSTPLYYVTLRWYVTGIHYPIAYSRGYGNLVTPLFEYLSNITTSIEEHQLDKLRIYPNPCTSLLNLNTIDGSISIVEIIDISGAKIFEKRFSNIDTLQIDCSNFTKGFYILRLHTKNSILDRKLFIQ
jgi:hypothetical protein